MEVAELFDLCRQLASDGPSAGGTRTLHEVLVLACAEGTRGLAGSFGNLFSQVTVVCRLCGVSAADRVAIQTMRLHARQFDPAMSREEWLYDVRALAMLVSAVFRTAIPGPLLSLLPARNRPYTGPEGGRKAYVRCVVRQWDDRYIDADTADGEVTIDYGSTEGGRDFAYLGKLLRKGMQLNLLESEVTAGGQETLLPRHIVVEPDFLVDISSIAACFTDYGHHPLLYTVNRLKPRMDTQAILLGNFAGTALDDLIHDPHATTAHILRRSFRQQAIRFSACEPFNAQKFKEDAEQQVRNIREAVSALRPKDALLEPSFVCEQLGLQGRVDLMTTDMRLLVEQKSGKNMKIERGSHDSHGRQLESHYVQLLLYYGILRYNFGRTDQTVDIRLLYSRYPASQGLMTVNYYVTLFREALRFRNQVVAVELMAAREGFGRIVPLLSPAIIYKEVRHDSFFLNYILPGLQQLQDGLNSLSPLERAYYERMMTFVYREQLFQKLGGAAVRLHHSGGCASDLWQMSTDEKLQTGNIFTGLIITDRQKTGEGAGGFDLITLSIPQHPEPEEPDLTGTESAPPNFRRGDMVCLYTYRGEPDVRRSILYKGTLESVSADFLTVRLNDGQQNPDVFSLSDGKTWAVEHAGSDLSASTSIRAIQQFAVSDPGRRSLLLGQRAPQADTSVQLKRSYSPDYDPVLLKASQARDYFLLIGPPGTGKTSQALRFLIAETLPGHLLLTAYTNRAVDEICAMLESENWPYLRIGNAASCDPRYRSHLASVAFSETLRLDDIKTAIREMPIVVGTTSSLQSHQELLRLKRFELCIVDEASQILEPSIIGLLSHPSIGRFVLVGDYKQLPAVVSCGEEESRVNEDCLREIGLTDCRQSLFERLIRWEWQHERRDDFIGVLDRQGRMHPDVALFPCRHFYWREQLLPVPLPHQREETLPYNVQPEDELDRQLMSRRVVFLSEASVADLLRRVCRFYGQAFDPDKTVGVIVTYRNQIGKIRQEAQQLGIPALQSVCIDTVERYQGSQREVIIYDFGVTRRYQLDFLTASTFVEDGHVIDRKLNVAMTRARRQLILTGQPGILRWNPLLRELIEQYQITVS